MIFVNFGLPQATLYKEQNSFKSPNFDLQHKKGIIENYREKSESPSVEIQADKSKFCSSFIYIDKTFRYYA